ncbi:alpha/beta fold hydrolase [Isachenkonia alkalipeptolytica]|uniref:Alpha/beta hydrolase n=1 Tax=Isachenkonia alkalipeptolytica TaxID=2565777 RepID=A0AA43XM96_9CLOT|nr:alpha/beta hydrolase [Isachenkonia alkalipeptolytica]NBG89438.1 alpha/beta hydrolase [Isachenkonia alkalipeptolytica]
MALKKKMLLTVLTLLLILQTIPFLIPLSEAWEENPSTPFQNSRWSKVEGIDLHYRTWLPGIIEHNPIVYIHGLGGSTFSWRYNVEPFIKEGFPVIALDLPTFGYSTRDTGLSHSQENRSQWVFGLLDVLETEYEFFSEGYHLVGHSMGGGVITAMALDNPEKIQTLTYVAGAVINEPGKVQGLLSYPPFKRTISVLGEHIFFTESRLEGVLSSAYGEEINQEILEGYLQPLRLSGTGRAWGDLVTSTTSFQEEDISHISIPTFLIWGEEDSWVPLEEGIRLKKLLQNSELSVIEGSGHTPMETDREEFNKRLLQFLSYKEKDDSGTE